MVKTALVIAAIVFVVVGTLFKALIRETADSTSDDLTGCLSVIGRTLFSLLSPILFLVLIGLLFNAGTYLSHIVQRVFLYFLDKLGLKAVQVGIAAIMTGIGIGAYFFKAKNQKWYGVVEVMVGVVGAVVVAGTLGPRTVENLSKWSTLAGSSYVIARGLGNYSETSKNSSGAKLLQ